MPDWLIHHLNGIRDDNRPENLIAMPRQDMGDVSWESFIKDGLGNWKERLSYLKGH